MNLLTTIKILTEIPEGVGAEINSDVLRELVILTEDKLAPQVADGAKMSVHIELVDDE